MLLDHGVTLEAADIYRRIIAFGSPDAAEYDGLGEALFAARDYPGADAAFRQALSMNSADSEATRKSGLIEWILDLDPERHDLSPRERYRRSRICYRVFWSV